MIIELKKYSRHFILCLLIVALVSGIGSSAVYGDEVVDDAINEGERIVPEQIVNVDEIENVDEKVNKSKKTLAEKKVDKVISVAKSKKGKSVRAFPKYFRNGGWCGHFVNWSFRKAGLNDNKVFPKNRIGSPTGLENWYKKKNLYKKSSKNVKVKKGDLAFFSSSHHVGIVAAVSGKYVYIVHGNWSNRVKVTKIKKYGYTRSQSAQIKGYASIKV